MQSISIEKEVQQLFNANNDQIEALQKIIKACSQKSSGLEHEQPPHYRENKLVNKIKSILNRKSKSQNI